MIDIPKAIRDFLLDRSGVTDLVGTRIYAGRDQPPVSYEVSDGDCLTFRVRGGDADHEDAIHRPSVYFKCYGGTIQGSWTLYRALRDALQFQAGGEILYATEEMTGHALEEPDSEWPFVLCAFRFLIRRDVT